MICQGTNDSKETVTVMCAVNALLFYEHNFFIYERKRDMTVSDQSRLIMTQLRLWIHPEETRMHNVDEFQDSF